MNKHNHAKTITSGKKGIPLGEGEGGKERGEEGRKRKKKGS